MDTTPSPAVPQASAAQPASVRVQPGTAGTPPLTAANAATTGAAAVPAARVQPPDGLSRHPAKPTALTMAPAHGDTASAAGAVGGTLFALALVLGLIVGLAWLARRMPGLAGMRGGNGLRVVASLALGPRERLVVVEVGQTQLLLGTGASGTRLLHTLEAPLPVAPPPHAPAFAQLLAQRLGKKSA